MDTIKNTITSKLKKKVRCNEEIDDKRKVKYFKNMVYPNLEN